MASLCFFLIVLFLLTCIVLNAVFVFLWQIGDMSLADSGTMCLSAVIMQLSEVGCPEAHYKEIVQYMILDAVRKGLKSKTEVKTSGLSAYITLYNLFICILHSYVNLVVVFTECTEWLYYSFGLFGENLPEPSRVSGSGAADRL